jgi:hypothetical protein
LGRKADVGVLLYQNRSDTEERQYQLGQPEKDDDRDEMEKEPLTEGDPPVFSFTGHGAHREVEWRQ